MSTRGKWPNGSDPWLVWNRKVPAPDIVPVPTISEQVTVTVNEKQPSAAVASIAGKVLAGAEPTQSEVRSLAASVLSQKAG